MHGGREQAVDDEYPRGSGATRPGPKDPERIGAFRVLGVLGTGGMGRVYLATARGRYAAVKRVLPALATDEEFLRHFGHELDSLAKLGDGVTARLLDSDRTEELPWFATEYIPGITLTAALHRSGPLPADSLWRLLRDGARGLDGVHAAGMVHRDLKPSNVMVHQDGVTLIDFGVARAVDQSRLTRTGMIFGTPAYMAPEQAAVDRKLTGASDVFAFASLLVFAANGRPPFGDGAGPDTFYRIVHTEPELGKLPECDAELTGLVKACLAKDPAARPSAAQLVEYAGRRVPDGAPPPWPPSVMGLIRERVAFAATPPPVEQPEALPQPSAPTMMLRTPVPQAVAPVPPAVAPVPGPEPVTEVQAPRSPRERRTRLLLVGLPVVAVLAVTVTFGLGLFRNDDAKGRLESAATSPAVASHPAAGPTPSSDPFKGAVLPEDGTASPSPSKKASPSPTKTTGKHRTAPASAGVLLRNASSGRCIAETGAGNSPVLTSCGTSAGDAGTYSYTWTYKSLSNGTFHLVSHSGACLTLSAPFMKLDPCGSDAAQVWRSSATTAQGHTLENVSRSQCLAVFGNFGAQMSTCNSSSPAQIWSNS
jgi:serine/threonine protein kinase